MTHRRETNIHIPDGYLGPITWIVLWIVMVPIWIIAARRLKKKFDMRQVPLLAIGAAFSFIIMMFNIPILGGSTGHAVGGTFLAIILGPEAALLAISVGLIIQAFFFGDGGITAIGANCFNIGFILPFVGYAIYRIMIRKAKVQSPIIWIAAGIGSYVGINAAAIFTGFELGLQTILHPAIGGEFPYFMYPITIAVPTMALEHLILFGLIEAIVTMLVVIYLQKNDPALLGLTKIPDEEVGK